MSGFFAKTDATTPFYGIDSLRLFKQPGCSVVASAPALGAGYRRFESCHPDQIYEIKPARLPCGGGPFSEEEPLKTAVDRIKPTRAKLTIEVTPEEFRPSI
ncbi:MAG: hypothetical protein RLY34_148, partial [Actinomycetota bacterium]